MCIAILKKRGRVLKDWVFENSFGWHPDGAGFLVWDHKKNKLICKKGFFTLKAFREAFAPYEDDYLAVIHFRKTTHGEINEENCHPFLVNDGLGFVHNGIIRDVKMYDKQRSDTWHFCQTIMKPLVDDMPDVWKHPTIRFLIEHFISERSKLIFLDRFGSYKIFNEKQGKWDCECWFSNDTYLYNPHDMNILSSNPKAFDRAWENWEPKHSEKGKEISELVDELEELFADDAGSTDRELDMQLELALQNAE